MKIKFICLLTLIISGFCAPLLAQEDKTVTITVSGQGKTQDEAKQHALRSAIEQAFGTFISSNTSILNDNLVKDEIVSVSSGNIQKYDVLNTSTLPDGTAAVTLSAVVSVSKLISFSEAKGVVIEFKGGLFTINVKQQILNEQAEVKAIWEMLFMLNPIAFQSFDYTIQNKDPQSLDTENKNWAIPITVTATTNKNIDFLFDYFQKNLVSISLKNEEVTNYKSLNKKIFPVNYNGIKYYLRKEESQRAIYTFFSSFPDIYRNFMVDDGFIKQTGHALIGKSEKDVYIRGDKRNVNFEEVPFYFKGSHMAEFYNLNETGYYPYVPIPSGTTVGTFTFNDLKNLAELEKLSGYRVNPIFPISKVGSWYAGGIIFYENGKGGGLVTAVNNLGEAAWGGYSTRIPTSTAIGSGQANTNAIIAGCTIPGIAARLCDDALINGFSDWFLPSKNELNLLYFQKHFMPKDGSRQPPRGWWWSSSQPKGLVPEGYNNESPEDQNHSVFPVRVF
jgi:hypothetical protein